MYSAHCTVPSIGAQLLLSNNFPLSLSLSLNSMASASSSPSPSSAPSASNSENSATQLNPRTPSHDQDVATDNGVRHALEKKPPSVDPFEDMNSEEYIEIFSKYETDYTRRLMAKYFSDKDIYGGNVFDEGMTIDGETIKASRWHCAQSYADPVQFLKEKSSSSSTPADAPTSISNGKILVKEE